MTANPSIIPISHKTARFFAKTCCSLTPTKHHFHQTLSFPDELHRNNLAAALKEFRKWLDWLKNAFGDAGILAVREYTKAKGIHFQILILFWGRADDPRLFLQTELRPKCWNAWRNICPGAHKDANWLTLPPNNGSRPDLSFRYFIHPEKKGRKVKIVANPKRDVHWFFIRNKSVLRANSSDMTKGDISAAKKTLFREKRRYPAHRKSSDKKISSIG